MRIYEIIDFNINLKKQFIYNDDLLIRLKGNNICSLQNYCRNQHQVFNYF